MKDLHKVDGEWARPALCAGTVFIRHTSVTLNPGRKLVKHVRGLKCTPGLWLTVAQQPQLTKIRVSGEGISGSLA